MLARRYLIGWRKVFACTTLVDWLVANCLLARRSLDWLVAIALLARRSLIGWWRIIAGTALFDWLGQFESFAASCSRLIDRSTYFTRWCSTGGVWGYFVAGDWKACRYFSLFFFFSLLALQNKNQQINDKWRKGTNCRCSEWCNG